MVARIEGNREAAAIYRQNHRDLVRQAIRGAGPLVDRLASLREADLRRLRCDGALAAFFAETAKLIGEQRARPAIGALLAIPPDMFLCYRDLRLPMLLEPSLMDLELDGEVLAILGDLPCVRAADPLAQKILAEAVFVDGDRRYRTEFVRGTPRIRGERKNSIRALASIAHELGHCLAEYGQVSTAVDALVASESRAHALEELCVDSYFRQRGMTVQATAWWRYQRQLDALNVYFFAVENAAFFGGEVPFLLSESVQILREPLFTMPGYQVVYARASVSRLSRLSRIEEIQSA